MAFEPNYEKLVTSYKRDLNTAQARVDVRLSTVDQEEIKSILCSSAKAHIINAEISGNTINYNGQVNFQVIYESAMGDIQGLDYTAEFVDKYSSEDVPNLQLPIVDSGVIDVEINVLNANTISATAIVETRISGVINENTDVLSGIEASGVYTEVESNKFYSFLGKLSEKYDLVQDVELLEGVSKVLSVTPAVALEGVKPSDNFALVKGNVFVDMCYLTNEENPKVRSYTTSYDFSMEVALEGVNEDTYILSNIYINTTDIKVTSNLEQDKALINLVLPIVYNGFAFTGKMVNNVVDMYSVNNELNVTSASVQSLLPNETITAMDKINGSVMVEDFVDEILGNCCNYVSVTSTFVEEDSVTIEGVANTTVLYYNKEDNSKNSIIVEMPFSVKVNGNNFNENSIAQVNCVMNDISAKSKRGQEIEVFAKLYLYVELYSTNTSVVISQVSIGEAIAPPDCAFKIYVVKNNETLWDVAKNLRTSEEDILNQNKDLELPLKAGDRVLIYYQKVMEF